MKLFHDGKLHSPWLSVLYNLIGEAVITQFLLLSWSPLELPYHLTTYVFILPLRRLSVKLTFTPACFIYSARGQVFFWWQRRKIKLPLTLFLSQNLLIFCLNCLKKVTQTEKRNVFKAQARRHIFVYSFISPSLHTLAS